MKASSEYRTDKATVRIHGSPDPDKLRDATIRFLKKAEAQRKKDK